jgi:hypothetical protein
VIPNPNAKLVKDRYGVAYGIENLDYAKSTVEVLIEKLKDIDINQYGETQIVFEKVFKYFNL